MHGDEVEKSYDRTIPRAGASIAGGSTARGLMDQAREMNACASESMRSRLHRKARESANDAARHERLAEKLTPDIEVALWCLRECIALGVIDIEELIKSGYAARERGLRPY